MIRWMLLAMLLSGQVCVAAVTVTDTTGQQVTLDKTPKRIVSLAPHLTEILFSLDAGDRIVATVRYADYPEEAKSIPRLGDAFSISVESVVALEPDLIVAWTTGGSGKSIMQLQALGYPVYLNEPKDFDDIVTTVRSLSLLLDKADLGEQLISRFDRGLSQVMAEHHSLKRPAVFFQIADAQLYTVNGTHLIGQAIEACGAVNIFADLSIPVPMVSFESVVEANPDRIIVSAPYEGFISEWQDDWQRLGWEDRTRSIDASLITRPSLRMVKGVKSLCNLIND